MDCHNRPSHSYELPDRGMDHAMAAGAISTTLPLAKKKSVELLKATTEPRRGGAAIPAAFVKFYQEKYPAIYAQRQAEIAASAKEVLGIWKRNIFPEMKVTWGAYPINIGHTDFPGCFRCHDGGPPGRQEYHAGLQRLPQPAGHGRSRAEDPDRSGRS